MTLDELRAEIDEIDGDLVRLLNARAAKALKAGEEKRKDGLPILDGDREQQVIEKVTSQNCGPLDDDCVADIYRLLMNTCTELQKKAAIDK